jgi:hypothetical protein
MRGTPTGTICMHRERHPSSELLSLICMICMRHD